MVGPAIRIVGTWVVTTALIVLGVDAAVERVASDVAIERPAPMSHGEVDQELRERQGHAPVTGSTTSSTNVTTSEPPTTPPAPTTAPSTPTTHGEPPHDDHGPVPTDGSDGGHQPPTSAPRGDAGRDGSQRP